MNSSEVGSSIDADFFKSVISELRKLPSENTCVEFKVSYANPEAIGEYISALSNAAALAGNENGYVVWGIRDQTHEVVGTEFKPGRTTKGGESIESWLLRLLNPRLNFRFCELVYENHPVVLLQIPRAPGRPVQFQGQEFIRVGSHRQKLKDHPQIEQELWRTFDTTPFERQKAAERLDGSDLLALLDYPSFFSLLNQPLPSDRDAILDRLAADSMIVRNQARTWDITNLGAALFARSLSSFRGLARKPARVILYSGKGRLQTTREWVEDKGYGAGFETLVGYVNGLVPRNEVIGQALRTDVPMYPGLAIRELIANALVHQDFSITGAGPMIELFDDRMEITNPGRPLVDTNRFLDTPPRSRNEALASFMRRIGICEERGSGVDKVVFQVELYQLPAPIFEVAGGSTRAVLFAHKALSEMGHDDRVRACYLHACLRQVGRDPMTNASLRTRFGIKEQNAATASRIIREALEDGWVKPYDAAQSKRYAKYLPFWA